MRSLLETLFKIVVGVAIVFTMFVIFTETQRLQEFETRAERVLAKIHLMDRALVEAEQAAIDEALLLAPSGRSIYQLRGDAQRTAQAIMNKLTERYDLPEYILPAIRFRPVIHHVDEFGNRNPYAAGAASACEEGPIYHIELNEILYLRNYEEFLYMIIPHEVAHVVTCLRGGFTIEPNETRHVAAHSEEWQQVMSDLGFVQPADFIQHDLDLGPVVDYQRDLAARLDQALNEIDEILLEGNNE